MKRAMLQVLMESPLYFTYSLIDRLHLLKGAMSRVETVSYLQQSLSHWVKTGHFKRRNANEGLEGTQTGR